MDRAEIVRIKRAAEQSQSTLLAVTPEQIMALCDKALDGLNLAGYLAGARWSARLCDDCAQDGCEPTAAGCACCGSDA